MRNVRSGEAVAVSASTSAALPDEPNPQPGDAAVGGPRPLLVAANSAGAQQQPPAHSSPAQTSPARNPPVPSSAEQKQNGSAPTQTQPPEDPDAKGERELKQEEQQRMLGVIPSFNTAMTAEAAPIDAREIFHLFFKSSVDPFQFFAAGVDAGIEQAEDEYPTDEQGVEGYAKRCGASFADGFDGNRRPEARAVALPTRTPWSGSPCMSSAGHTVPGRRFLCPGSPHNETGAGSAENMRSDNTMLQRVLREDVGAQLVRLDMLLTVLDDIFQASAQNATSVPLMLLVGSILKVRQSGRAVKLLAQEGLVEEILAIGRALVEVTVNVAYLQCAGEKELDRYLTFQPELRHRRAGMLEPQPAERTSTQRFFSRIGDAMSALKPSGRMQQAEPGWSQRTLLQRAQLADELTDIPVMSLLLSRCYPRGGAAAHGTVGALATFVDSLQSPDLLKRDNRLSDLSEALFGVNLTLMTFNLFVDEFFALGKGEVMEQISGASSTTKASLVGE